MTPNSRFTEGLPEHDREVEMLPQDHGLLVQHGHRDGEDAVIALLGFPV